MNHPSVCLIAPFFDEKKKLSWIRKKQFPVYFQHFLETFSWNKSVDLKIFTNVPCRTLAKQYEDTSISFHRFSLKSMFERIREKLDVTGYQYSQYRAYKICDLKPMFGHIFSEYLSGYDYWGYIDPDAIIGNIDGFLNASNLKGYDVISGGRNNFTGYLALYRNTETINSLYAQSPDSVRIINSPNNFRFDENGGERGIVAMEHLTRTPGINTNYLNCVHNDFGKIDDSVDNSNRNWVYNWKNGMLTDKLEGTEIAMFHLMKSKTKPKFSFQDIRQKSIFSITKDGILVPNQR